MAVVSRPGMVASVPDADAAGLGEAAPRDSGVVRALESQGANDQEVVLGPGGYIVKPRNEVHAMWNAGPTPARMIEVITPAGFEDFFRSLTDLTAGGPPDPLAVVALAERYDLPFAEPEWLADVIERYGLTPPPPRR